MTLRIRLHEGKNPLVLKSNGKLLKKWYYNDGTASFFLDATCNYGDAPSGYARWHFHAKAYMPYGRSAVSLDDTLVDGTPLSSFDLECKNGDAVAVKDTAARIASAVALNPRATRH